MEAVAALAIIALLAWAVLSRGKFNDPEDWDDRSGD